MALTKLSKNAMVFLMVEIIQVDYGVEEAEILALNSINIETLIKASVAYLVGIVAGKKTVVAEIIDTVVGANVVEYTIIAKVGSISELVGHNPIHLPAGSSFNITTALRRLGAPSVGIVAPMGAGRSGASLSRSIAQKGVLRLLYAGKTTSITINILDEETGQSTLLCYKAPFEVDEELLSLLSQFRPKVVLATGIKPEDLPIVEVFATSPGVKMAFTPNPTLLTNAELRDSVLNIMGQCEIVQMNEDEASLILRRRFVPEDIQLLTGLVGSGILTVTMSERGSVTCTRDWDVHTQAAMPVKKVVDTSGVGDVHLAGLVKSLWVRKNPLSIPKALRMAAWVAACKVQENGPWSGVPSEEEYDKQLQLFESGGV